MVSIVTLGLGLYACADGDRVQDGDASQVEDTTVDPTDSGVRDCRSMLGEYPPDSIVFEGLVPVDVPYTSWSCLGFDSDTVAEEPPMLSSSANGEVTIKVEFQDDPTFEIKAETATDRVVLQQEIDDESVTVHLPEGTEVLWVRMCTNDGRCANYAVTLEQ